MRAQWERTQVIAQMIAAWREAVMSGERPQDEEAWLASYMARHGNSWADNPMLRSKEAEMAQQQTTTDGAPNGHPGKPSGGDEQIAGAWEERLTTPAAMLLNERRKRILGERRLSTNSTELLREARAGRSAVTADE